MKHNVGPRDQLFRITVGSAGRYADSEATAVALVFRRMGIGEYRYWIDALLPEQSTDRH
jgi:hypothetical protein